MSSFSTEGPDFNFYHYGKNDTSQLVKLLQDYDEIEVRIRSMQ